MRVLARAYRDRPLDRVAVGVDGRVVFIADPSTPDSIRNTIAEGVGFPSRCVFQFDSRLFDQLADAWKAEDQGEVSRLWGLATPVNVSDIPVV